MKAKYRRTVEVTNAGGGEFCNLGNKVYQILGEFFPDKFPALDGIIAKRNKVILILKDGENTLEKLSQVLDTLNKPETKGWEASSGSGFFSLE